MIRREIVDTGGQPAWLLIAQIQHARLAGRIASHWQLDSLSPVLRRELIWATSHHDDGWDEWDRQPELDDRGRPISFLEMPSGRSVEIWGRSIERAAAHSPLAGLLVADHFLRLRSSASWAEQPAAIEFNRCATAQAADFLQRSLDQASATWEEPALRYAGQQIRLFDRLSLQLCCGADPRLGDNGPSADGLSDRWPINRPKLRLSLQALRVEARHYVNVQDLKRRAVTVRLRWTLSGTDGN